MSTIGYSSWAVDLKDVAAVYPFQGFEIPMVAACTIFWLWWHLAQMRQEDTELTEIKGMYQADRVRTGVDRY